MLFRIFKYSVKNSLRNKFLSVSSILVLTLLMFFINILGELQDVSYKLIGSINSKLTISLYINENQSKTSLDIKDFMNDIIKLNKNIGVEYKTKDDILNDMRIREPDLVKILERSNPLPDTIILSNIAINDYEKVNALVESKMYLLVNDENQEDYFANYTTQYQKIEDVISVLGVLQLGLGIVIIIFMVSIAIIIYSVIGNFVYYYRDEIYITKLVGGANLFIYGPFVLQGMLYSIIAFVLNLIVFALLLKNLNILFGDIYLFSLPIFTLVLEIFIFLLIGGISGYFSSKKYLKQKVS